MPVSAATNIKIRKSRRLIAYASKELSLLQTSDPEAVSEPHSHICAKVFPIFEMPVVGFSGHW
jgi:hypothetical protein